VADAALPISERLKNGAKILGVLWRSGQRCAGGFHLGCQCSKMTKFCVAKLQWVTMAIGEGREMGDGPYGLVESMTAAEFVASALTISIDISGVGTYKVGPKGSIKIPELIALATSPESVSRVFKVLDHFPGSVVVSVDEPKKEEAKA
jgi:hypothetical protein